MNVRLALALAATALTLSACGTQVAAPVPAPATPAAAPAPVESVAPVDEGLTDEQLDLLDTVAEYDRSGSITTDDGRFVEYPDGLRVDFVSAIVGGNTYGKDGYVDVTITLQYSNSGTNIIDTTMWGAMGGLLYGVNGESAFTYAGDEWLPSRLSPGTIELQQTINAVPVSAIGQPMEYQLVTDMLVYTDYTFLDVDTAL